MSPKFQRFRLILDEGLPHKERFKRLNNIYSPIKTSNKSGVIGLSANLTFDQIDLKLTSLLNKSKKGDLFGRVNYIK